MIEIIQKWHPGTSGDTETIWFTGPETAHTLARVLKIYDSRKFQRQAESWRGNIGCGATYIRIGGKPFYSNDLFMSCDPFGDLKRSIQKAIDRGVSLQGWMESIAG